MTPEGITVSFRVATAGDRLAAFLLDIVIIGGLTLVLGVLAVLSFFSDAGEVAVAFSLLAAFFLRNFYFMFFELKWSGTTFGKRRMGLRVIARDGGPLTADMIFARNFTRDLEVFLPLTVLLAPEVLFPGGGGWGAGAAALWLFVFMFLPLFSRYRLRCGDLIAGTIVVLEPTSALLPDLAAETRKGKAEVSEDESEYSFTVQQLEMYGIHELQVLEDLVRKQEKGEISPRSLKVVCEKIKKKIGWPRAQWKVDTVRFLRAFYKAQRSQLERKLLFGHRKERKSGGKRRGE